MKALLFIAILLSGSVFAAEGKTQTWVGRVQEATCNSEMGIGQIHLLTLDLSGANKVEFIYFNVFAANLCQNHSYGFFENPLANLGWQSVTGGDLVVVTVNSNNVAIDAEIYKPPVDDSVESASLKESVKRFENIIHDFKQTRIAYLDLRKIRVDSAEPVSPEQIEAFKKAQQPQD